MAKKVEYTSIDFKVNPNQLFFTINKKDEYIIPSSLFPIPDKDGLSIITTENTFPYKNQRLFDKIDELDLPIGMCYSNSKKIEDIGLELNLEISLFSGWIILNGDMPKHHAWIVVKHDAGFSIIDSLKEKLFRKASENFPIDYKDPDWRKKSALAIKQTQRELNKNSDQIIIGKVPNGILYCGCPDTAESARKTFQQLSKKYPKHPSYQGEGNNMFGASKLQEEINRINRN